MKRSEAIEHFWEYVKDSLGSGALFLLKNNATAFDHEFSAWVVWRGIVLEDEDE